MKNIMMLSIFVATICIIINGVRGIEVYDTCAFDGYYTCNVPTFWVEEPSGAAIHWIPGYDNFTSPPVLLPFTMKVFGSDIIPSNGVSFDNDFTIRVTTETSSILAIAAALNWVSPNSGSSKYFEVVGTAPNRRALFTWKHFGNDFDVVDNSVQMKIFENGKIEFHYQSLVVSTDYILVGIEYLSGSSYNADFPKYFKTGSSLTGTSIGFTVGTNVTPAAYCGTQSYDSGTIGYFCADNGASFYMCLEPPFDVYSNKQPCATGSICRCSDGVECSDHNMMSPCT